MAGMSAPAEVLDAARSGDAAAFERLVSSYREELLAHCYRMLGSRHDAEDVLQEALVRAWRGVGGLDERGFVRAWLYKIATNRCLTALQRLRKTIDTTRVSRQSMLHELGSDAVNEIGRRWIDAWQDGDVDAIVAMLADEARFSMPPLPEWYRGTDAIRAFLVDGPLRSRWRFLPTSANAQLAFGTYLWDHDAGAYLPGGLDVLTLHNGQVSEIVSFLTADLTDFGLPAD